MNENMTLEELLKQPPEFNVPPHLRAQLESRKWSAEKSIGLLAIGVDVLIERHDRIAKILAEFYRAPLSMSSVQPILDLAVELNPELKETTR